MAGAAAVKLGDPLDHETDLGPMVDAAAAARAQRGGLGPVSAQVAAGAPHAKHLARVRLPCSSMTARLPARQSG